MTERSDRFRQRRLARAAGLDRIKQVSCDDLVRWHLESAGDDGRVAEFAAHVEAFATTDTSLPVITSDEVATLLSSIHGEFSRKRFDGLIAELRRSALQAVTGPMGLGYVVSGLEGFDAGSSRQRSASFQPGAAGNRVVIVLSAPGRHEEKARRPAANEHGTGGNIADFVRHAHARDPARFPSPDLADYRIVNAWDKVEFQARTGRSEATVREIMDPRNLARLRADIGDAETVITFGNRANDAVDALELTARRMRGLHPSPRSINKKYKSDKVTKEEKKQDRLSQFREQIFGSDIGDARTPMQRAATHCARAGDVGARMAVQQVISVVLSEFATALFDELGDCWANGIVVAGEGFLAAVGRRAKAVQKRLFVKWRTALDAGTMGMVSGFLSELVNITMRTVRGINARFDRIVREGVGSLVRALRMVLAPSPGVAPVEVWHEASKLMAAGVVTSGGILLEEIVTKALPGFDFVTNAVVAIFTGFAVATTMYGMDRLDMFGAYAIRRQVFTNEELERRVAVAMEEIAMLEFDRL